MCSRFWKFSNPRRGPSSSSSSTSSCSSSEDEGEAAALDVQRCLQLAQFLSRLKVECECSTLHSACRGLVDCRVASILCVRFRLRVICHAMFQVICCSKTSLASAGRMLSQMSHRVIAQNVLSLCNITRVCKFEKLLPGEYWVASRRILHYRISSPHALVMGSA